MLKLNMFCVNMSLLNAAQTQTTILPPLLSLSTQQISISIEHSSSGKPVELWNINKVKYLFVFARVYIWSSNFLYHFCLQSFLIIYQRCHIFRFVLDPKWQAEKKDRVRSIKIWLFYFHRSSSPDWKGKQGQGELLGGISDSHWPICGETPALTVLLSL